MIAEEEEPNKEQNTSKKLLKAFSHIGRPYIKKGGTFPFWVSMFQFTWRWEQGSNSDESAHFPLTWLRVEFQLGAINVA